MLLLHPIDNWLFTSRTCQRVVFSCSLSFWAAACIRFSRCLVFLDCLYDSICNHILQDIFKHISHSLRFAQLTVSVLVHYHNDTFMRFVNHCLIRLKFDLWARFVLNDYLYCLALHRLMWRVLDGMFWALREYGIHQLQSDIIGGTPGHVHGLLLTVYQYIASAHLSCISDYAI